MLLTKAYLAISAVLVIFVPFGRIQEHRVKFIKKPLKITTTKATPPRLAFIQTLKYEAKKEKLNLPEPAMTVNLTEVISKRQLRPLAFVLQRRQVSIPEILITRAEIYHQAAAKLTQTVKSNPKFDEPVRAKYSEQAPQNWPETLTDKEKRWLDRANVTSNDFEVFNEASPDPVSSNIQAQVAEELKRPSRDVLPGWIISRPSEKSNENPSEKSTDRPSNKSPRGYKTYQVQGRIELALGLFWGPGEHIEINWTREGASKVAGLINTENDFKYEVNVTELVGSVNAEMYDNVGRLKAKGSLRLSPNSLSGKIVLQPQTSLASHMSDFYNSNKGLFGKTSFKKSESANFKTKVSVDQQAEFTTDAQSQLKIDGVVPGSTAFGFTKGKGYYPAIHWMTTGAPRLYPVIPVSTVNAWKDIIRNQRVQTPVQDQDGGFVVGQATREGRPTAGVRVEMLQDPDTKPIYLNDLLIPDPSLTETAANGHFIFMDLENGYYSVRATKGNFFFGFSNFLAEMDSVSFSEIQDVGKNAPFEVRVFDAFQGTDEQATIDLQGLNAPIEIEGYGKFDHPVTDQIELVQVQPRNHDLVPSMYVIKGDDDYLHVPLVRRAWLEQMASTMQLSPQPGAGTVIGFVSKGNYQVLLPHLGEQAPVTVVFFDASGSRVEQPVENGGFIAFNVPASAHTIVVRDNFGETASQIIPVDPDRVTTVRFLF